MNAPKKAKAEKPSVQTPKPKKVAMPKAAMPKKPKG